MIAPAVVQKPPVLGRGGVVATEDRPAAGGEPWDGFVNRARATLPRFGRSARGRFLRSGCPGGTLPQLRRDGENALPSLPHSSA